MKVRETGYHAIILSTAEHLLSGVARDDAGEVGEHRLQKTLKSL